MSGLYDYSFRKLYQRIRQRIKATRDENQTNIVPREGLSRTGAGIRRWLSLIVDFPDFSWRGKKRLLGPCEDIMRENNIDLIIASHPFVLSMRCAAKLAHKFKVPWIADMRDGWTGNLFSPYLEYPALNFCLGLVERSLYIQRQQLLL